jgi:hypothetical protein
MRLEGKQLGEMNMEKAKEKREIEREHHQVYTIIPKFKTKQQQNPNLDPLWPSPVLDYSSSVISSSLVLDDLSKKKNLSF